MEKKIQLDPKLKAPAHIKNNIQQTLNNYRLVGNVTELYVEGFLQTLIDFTNLFDPEPPSSQTERPDTTKNKNIE